MPDTSPDRRSVSPVASQWLSLTSAQIDPAAKVIVAQAEFLAREVIRLLGAEIDDGTRRMRHWRQLFARDPADHVDAGGTDRYLHVGVGGAGLKAEYADPSCA